MSPPTPRLTARQVDLVRGWARDPAQVGTDEHATLVAAGALTGRGAHPVVAEVAAVLERSWASFRVRRWRDGERVDLVGAVGPSGVALLAGPPGLDEEREIVHRPRWTSTARALAGFVGLGPEGGAGPLPASARWDDVVAATGPSPPRWLLDVDPGGMASVTLWDLAWTMGATRRPSRLTVLDIGLGLAEIHPDPGDWSETTMVPRRSTDIWLALCHLLGDAAPRTSARPV